MCLVLVGGGGGGGSEYLLNTSVVDIFTIGISNYSVFTSWKEYEYISLMRL